MTEEVRRFQRGRVYACPMLVDWDRKLYFQVVRRTATTVTLRSVIMDETGDIIDGPYPERMTCRVKRNSTYSLTEVKEIPHEFVKPLGSYAMCPVLTAIKPL